MKYCIINGGYVTNIVVSDTAREANWVPHESGVNIGWTWNGSVFAEPNQNITLAQAKKIAIAALKDEYTGRTEAGVIENIRIGDISDQIQDAAIMITNSFSTDYAVVHGQNSLLLNASKLAAIYGYKKACSDQAKAHAQAINGLGTKASVKNYIQNDLQTGWPSTAL